MKKWSVCLLVTLMLALGVNSSAQRLTGLRERVTSWLERLVLTQFNDRQVRLQTEDKMYPLQKSLDFTPFATAFADDLEEAALDVQVAHATIADLHEAMRAGELQAATLTLYYLKRIARYDGYLNSVLELNPEALSRAAQLDAEMAANPDAPLKPLHGIPVLLKDNIATATMHTTAGAAALADAVADRDAFIVTRLQDAGAIILGKTNLSEWANFMTFESVNGFSALGGATRNAYNTQERGYDVSGSSSGSASAVAAALTQVSIGSETSGSLLSPASFNSVVTIKPSLGLVSRNRIIPITDKQDTAGPMTRSVHDLAVVLSVIAGVDSEDEVTTHAASLEGTDFTTFIGQDVLQGAKVGMFAPSERVTEDDPVLTKVTEAFEALGAEVVRLEPSNASNDIDVLPIFFYGLREGVNAYLQATSAPVSSLAEVIAFNKEEPDSRAPYGQDLLEKSQTTQMSADEYEQLAMHNAAVSRAFLDGLLTEVDFIVGWRSELAMFTAPSGYPALSLPAGYLQDGEPIGMTLSAGYLQDGKLIAAAAQLEAALEARKVPTLPFIEP